MCSCVCVYVCVCVYDAVSANVMICVLQMRESEIVKWCRKREISLNLMYICHKQCEIMQKFKETAQTANLNVGILFVFT